MKTLLGANVYLPFAILAALGAYVPIAHAVFETSYSGTACNPTDSAISYTTFPEGFVPFTTSSLEEGTCGIARHNVSNTNGLQDLELKFRSFGGSGSVTCTAFSMSTIGNVLISSTINSAGQTIDWGNAINVSTARGAGAVSAASVYSIDCEIPARIGITSYYVKEP
jgi:hypothetical protein